MALQEQKSGAGFFTGTANTPFMLSLGYYNLAETFAKFEQYKKDIEPKELRDIFIDTHEILVQSAIEITNKPELAAKFGGRSIFAVVRLAEMKFDLMQAEITKQLVGGDSINNLVKRFSQGNVIRSTF